MFTKAEIKKDGEICFIPLKMLLSESVAAESPLGIHLIDLFFNDPLVDPKKYPHGLAVVILAAFMVQQLYQPDSFFLPYLQCLPKAYDLPICWPTETIKNLLNGTPLEFIATERRLWIQSIVKSINQSAGHFFPENKLDEKDFLWAFASISSRAFPKAKPKGLYDSTLQSDWIAISEICLYPVLDMLNHKRNFKIEWVMTDQGVSFISKQDIPANTEVFNNYGSKGNENLFGNYGFVLDPNPEDYVKLVFNTSAKDPHASKRKSLMKINSLSPFQMIFLDDTDLGPELRKVTQIMVSDEIELRLFKENPSFVSKRLLLRSLTTLLSLLNGKLAKINPLDPLFEEEYDPNWLRMAKVYRQGQRNILVHYITLVDELRTPMIHPDFTRDSNRFLSPVNIPSTLLSSLSCFNTLQDNPSMDEFTKLAFILESLLFKSQSNEQQYRPAIDVLMKTSGISVNSTAKAIKKVLGSEWYAQFKDFFESEIQPLCNDGFARDGYAVVFALLSIHGDDHTDCEGNSVFGLYFL